MNQLELEAGQGKKNCFQAYQHETLDHLPDKAVGTRKCHCFKT